MGYTWSNTKQAIDSVRPRKAYVQLKKYIRIESHVEQSTFPKAPYKRYNAKGWLKQSRSQLRISTTIGIGLVMGLIISHVFSHLKDYNLFLFSI